MYPVPVQVSGRVEEEPQWLPPENDVLRSRPAEEATRMLLAVERVRQGGDWQSVQGRVRVYLAGRVTGVHLGDEIEVPRDLIEERPGQLVHQLDKVHLGGTFDHEVELFHVGCKARDDMKCLAHGLHFF